MLGYRLRREKDGRIYLFTEWDWADSESVGTVIPLARLEEEPPEEDDVLLAWLAVQETRHADAIAAAWNAVLRRSRPR